MTDTSGQPPVRMLLLHAPSANRVYARSAPELAAREARRVLAAHLDPGAVVTPCRLGGLEYLEVQVQASPARTLRVLGTLSGALGAFTPVPGPQEGSTLLAPEELADPSRLPEDLETTLRYPGKTNEQFTALLLNLAAAASGRRAGLFDGTLAVLDPVCGRGTTLSRALRLGLSPVGADVDKTDWEAYRAFLLTWMRTHRLKHSSTSSRLSSHGRVLGSRFTAELARSKEERRAGEAQQVEVLRCATEELGLVLAHGATDAIVADLPYGVQHGARSGGMLRRSPLDLLAEAVPVWRTLLRRDGAMALALNRRTAPYPEAAAVLHEAGLRVVTADGEFRHRVDQSIDRDVLVAVRTDHPQVEDPALCGPLADERTL